MIKRTLELADRNFRETIDFTDPQHLEALDHAECLCLGIFCNQQYPNSGRYGSYGIAISNIQPRQFDIEINHNDPDTVVKRFGKYAANHTIFGKYEVNDKLFRSK